MNDEKQSEQKPIDYNEELKKCLENLLYFINKYVSVKLKKQKPAWTNNDRTMAFTLMRDVDQMTYISDEGKNEQLQWLNSLEDKFNNVE